MMVKDEMVIVCPLTIQPVVRLLPRPDTNGVSVGYVLQVPGREL